MTDWRTVEQAGTVRAAAPRARRSSIFHAVRLAGSRPVAAPELLAVLVAAALVIGYLLAGLMGGDLTAQIARADFAADHPLSPVDLRWFAGFQPFGYSLWTPWVMAIIGVRVTGAGCTIAAAWLTTRLLRVTGAARPAWGGAAAAITLTSNLVEGRVTFGCGAALGIAALLLLTRPGPNRRVLASGCAFLAGSASPVAAMLLTVCAVALLSRRRLADAAMVSVPALIPAVALSLAFADPGRALFSGNDALRAIGASVLVAILVPPRLRMLRLGALLGAALVLAAYLLPSPIGVSAARFSLLFAVPVVVAFARVPRGLVPIAVAVTVAVQNPITFGTLRDVDQPATHASYYRPLFAAIASHGPVTGRVEIPELTGHWEAAYVARELPLARGWIRQTDIGQNDDTFYAHAPTAASYRTFLDRLAVQYVAVADARPTFYGRRESRLIAAGLPYLQRIWTDEHWTLYAVQDAASIVSAPGVLQSSDAASVTLTAPAGTQIRLRLRWFRWLSLDSADSGACLYRDGDQVMLRTGTGGIYRLSSELEPHAAVCG
ncbi:MAG: hypothetical protein ABJB98_00680 [Actinomycetota bacterium]